MNKRSLCWCLILFLMTSGHADAEPSSALYSAKPPLMSPASDPLVMLVMSVDHELFKKAYSDFSDLNADGKLDTGYNDKFNYLGYFNSAWCYSYSTSKNRFQPKKLATGTNKHFCTTSSAPWSGNFLNWATMSRIDILRKVLFGGKRFKDTKNQTILERAYLPRDVHAFVKVYSGTTEVPVKNLTPFNESAISLCNLAVSQDGAPVVRVASQAWPRWASTEVRQCQWGAQNSPPSSKKLAEHNVYIKSCVAGKGAEDSSHCKSYEDGKYKPVGLLQRYGEDGNLRFGLISGSYDKNISGGLLRKNISKLTGNSDTSKDEINISNGVFNGAVKGIIHNINAFRIAKYSYSQSKYLDCSTYGISVGTFTGNASRSTTSNRHCSNWGNPIAEMFLEALRYFSGEDKPSPQYDTDKDSYFNANVSKEDWVKPQTADNACANCSIILLSTGLNSFDTDQFGSANDIPGINGVAGVHKLTDEMGEKEAQTNPSVSIPGVVIADKPGGSRQCEETEISKLSDVKGICSEQPQLAGGYYGLPWHGRTHDLRPDLNGKQTVKTYAIQLADNVPSFSLDVGGKTVTFQPICMAHSNRSECSLTDVVVQSLADDRKSGKFLFTWEDSLWGNDYDYDASSSIEYCIGSACSPSVGESQVQITVRQEAKNAGAETWYSYTVSGTDKDGIVLPLAVDTGNQSSQGQGQAVATIFNATGSSATLLPKPLWFAAKYGGFVDQDGDGTPGYDANGDGAPDVGDNREWDSRNNTTGEIGADGLPDNYFFARNPSLLEYQLGQVLQDISIGLASATNTALVANNRKGVGVIYQALFQPELKVNNRSVSWGGLLHALFIDSKGWLREDSNQNQQLDDYATDNVVELVFEQDTRQTKIQRYSVSDDNKTAEGPLRPLHDLKTLWDARDALAEITDRINQRTYSAQASGGRHILTWLDSNNDSAVDEGEVLPFIAPTFTGNEGYLGIAADEVANVVNYIRGEEISGTRPRTIDYDYDGNDEVWRLGDIVHSTPALVAAPDSAFDALYNDTSFQAFKEKYKNRRHMVYVGANDGLIHAFNGGFWDSVNHGYKTTGGSAETSHPLGYELWAYAPMNLLPHLRWLSETDYPHVYYMDGEPQSFDVNIFNPDDDHPGGWGTILVIGMRLGGGPIGTLVGGSSRTMRSAYIVLDITNPEKPPELLAEITEPALGFTISKPALVKQRVAGVDNNWNSPAKNDWYLVFASGPAGNGEQGIRDALDKATSDQNLHIFAYDLKTRSFVTNLDPLTTSKERGYGGAMSVVDWNLDYQDDAVYFGSVQTGQSVLAGDLFRLQVGSTLSTSSVNVIMATGQPALMEPLLRKEGNNYWIYGGTGRLLVHDDNKDLTQQFLYGVKEPVDSEGNHTFGTVDFSGLVDTSNIEVLDSGETRINNSGNISELVIGGETIESFDELKQVMNNKTGWKIKLLADTVNPSGKSLAKANAFFSMILFNEYQPPADSCEIEGTSYLYALHYLTGTATPTAVLGKKDLNNNDEAVSLNKVKFNIGNASFGIHHGEDGQSSIISQGPGGSVKSKKLNYEFSSSGRQSWRQIFDIE